MKGQCCNYYKYFACSSKSSFWSISCNCDAKDDAGILIFSIPGIITIGKSDEIIVNNYKDGKSLINQNKYEEGFKEIKQFFEDSNNLIQGKQNQDNKKINSNRTQNTTLFYLLLIILIVSVIILLFLKRS